MSKLMNKMERKFGRYAISNISLYLIICYGFGYLIQMINPYFMNYLTLNPYLICRGQVWRLVSWILIPPSSSNLFFVLITLYFYYSIGTTLEHTWGTVRYNLYLFSGMLFTLLGSFVLWGISYFIYPDQIAVMGAGPVMQLLSSYFSTYYINMSIFLAFAATYPEMQVLLMFIIPIKVKWLGVIYGAMIVAQMLMGGFVTIVVIGASLLNFVVFFFASRHMGHVSPRQIKRRHEFRQEVRRSTGITKHKCAICGRTEQDSPDLEFRFCSKCDGNYEYCQEHLFTHEHVKRH